MRGRCHLGLGADVLEELDVVVRVEGLHVDVGGLAGPEDLETTSTEATRKSHQVCCQRAQRNDDSPGGLSPGASFVDLARNWEEGDSSSAAIVSRTHLHLPVEPVVEDQVVGHADAVGLHGVAWPVVVVSDLAVIVVGHLERWGQAHRQHQREKHPKLTVSGYLKGISSSAGAAALLRPGRMVEPDSRPRSDIISHLDRTGRTHGRDPRQCVLWAG